MGVSIKELVVARELQSFGVIEGATHYCDLNDLPISLIIGLYTPGRETVAPNSTLMTNIIGVKEFDRIIFNKSSVPIFFDMLYLGPDLLVWISPRPGIEPTERIKRKWKKLFVDRFGLDADRVEFMWSDCDGASNGYIN